MKARRSRPLIIWLALAAFVLVPERLRGATFNVANGDVYGPNGLVAVLDATNNNNQDDTVNLAAGGVYTLTVVNNTNSGSNGLPVIFPDNNHALTINGNGSLIQRSTAAGTPTFRIFLVACITQCPTKQTTFNNLIIQRGAAVTGSGGAIRLDFDGHLTLNNCVLTDNLANDSGGGISNGGRSLTLTNCTLSENDADRGAAVQNSTTLTATNCTFSNNHTVAGPGGALYNFGNVAVANLTNCTFDNNTRNPGGGTAGGGIFNNITTGGVGATDALMTLTHCTLNQTDVLNSGTYTGGDPPTCVITLRNCLLNDSALLNNTNPGHDRVHIDSEGYNLSSGDGGGNLTGPNDQTNVDPKLDPAGLQNYGGATRTIALLAESPGIDRGHSFGVPNDQRGTSRPKDLAPFANGPGSDGSDIGAFEANDPQQGGPVFIVNDAADQDDGFCGGVDCSLREAVAAANAAADANTITFAANVTGTITLGAALGQLSISNPVTIAGPGARVLALSGGGSRRVLSFGSGPSVLSGLTIRDGRFAALTSTTGALGGGLSNSATLTVNDCAFLNNEVVGGNNTMGGIFGTTGGIGRGGAISNLNDGVLTLNRCIFVGNSATGGRGFSPTGTSPGGTGGAGRGAAIVNDPAGTLAINNCTFTNNTATGGPGGNNTTSGARGGNGGAGSGAVFNAATMTLTASTVSGNVGVGGLGGLGPTPREDGEPGPGSGGVENSGSSSSTLRSTISAGNSGNGGPDAKGAFVSEGFNLIGIGDFATGINAATDQMGTSAAPLNANLAALANNGGSIDTIALLANSPAIDRGQSFALTTDQRGLARTRDLSQFANAAGGDGTDIGAFELSAGVPVLSIVSRKTHGASGAFDLAIPTTGATGVECRSGGAGLNHQIVITFPGAITAGGLSLTSSDNQATGSFSVAGSVVTLNLGGVANAQRLGLTLNSVTMGSTQGSVSISLGVLLGDSTRNSSVNASDVGLVKSLSGQPISAANFLSDVTLTGSINASDIGAVKAQSGTQLPATPAEVEISRH